VVFHSVGTCSQILIAIPKKWSGESEFLIFLKRLAQNDETCFPTAPFATIGAYESCHTHAHRAMKAITGLSYEEFTNLVPLFKHAYIAHKMANPLRKRSVGGGIKGKLPTYEAKLLFVLFYAKNYPTFDVLGFFFDKPRGQSCEDIHLFLKVLEKALGHAVVLPERKLTSAEEFLEN